MSKLACISVATALLTIVSTSACGGGASETVARVGTAAITKADFEHWTSVGAAMSPARPQSAATEALVHDPRGYRTLKQRTLGFLISSARTIGEAAERGVRTSDKEAKTALERYSYERIYGTTTTLPREAELRSLLSSKGETRSDQLWIMRVHMLAAKVEERQLLEAEEKVTYAQLAGYYVKKRDRYVVPERRNVEVIETFQKAKIDDAKREIDSGQSLLSVVRRRNDEPEVGGSKLGLSRRALPHRYEKHYFQAKPGVLVGPLKAEIYYLFEVTSIMPARRQTLGDVQTRIRQELIAGPQRQILTNIVRTDSEKWRSKTRCHAAYAVEQCGSPLT